MFINKNIRNKKLNIVFTIASCCYAPDQTNDLIKDNIELNADFITGTYKVWRFLLKNRLIYDLVDMDSRKRENKKIKYKKIK